MSALPARRWPRDPRFLVEPSGAIVGPSGRYLTPHRNSKGYGRISTYPGGGRLVRRFVHVIVCETFHGPRPPGHEAAHLNGDVSDCSAVNLAWKTCPDNNMDKITHGTMPHGERHPCTHLAADDVRALRAAAANGTTERALADRYGLSPSGVHHIITGRSWKYLH